MAEKKIKPLLPSLREKKRYLAFEISSRKPIGNPRAVSYALIKSIQNYIGLRGMAEAGAMFLPEKYDVAGQKGLLKVNNRYLDDARAALCLVREIEGQEAMVRSLGASGMIAKASEYLK